MWVGFTNLGLVPFWLKIGGISFPCPPTVQVRSVLLSRPSVEKDRSHPWSWSLVVCGGHTCCWWSTSWVSSAATSLHGCGIGWEASDFQHWPSWPHHVWWPGGYVWSPKPWPLSGRGGWYPSPLETTDPIAFETPRVRHQLLWGGGGSRLNHLEGPWAWAVRLWDSRPYGNGR